MKILLGLSKIVLPGMLILLENIKHSGRPRLVINEKSITEVKNLLT